MGTANNFLGIRKPYLHYYGDIIRILFFISAIIMLLTLPWLQTAIPVSIYISMLAIMVLLLIAGLTNPVQQYIAVINVVVSTSGLVIFEYFAATTYTTADTLFFLVNQTLAVLFLFAFYYAVKTLRGEVLRKRAEKYYRQNYTGGDYS